MSRIVRSALVPYPADAMFGMVADVERYPAFLPWCANARILEQRNDGLDARIDLRFMGVEQQFSTRNRHERPERILMQLLDGPFEHLKGAWHFEPLYAADPQSGPQPVGTRVGLMLDYRLRSGAFAKLFAPAFNRIAAEMMDAFLARADALYAPR